jgi:DNA-binding SARP family transcriptional activator
VSQGWDIRLLGPLRVETAGRRVDQGIPGRQGRLLLSYLVLNRERGAARAELMELLWPAGPPAAADSALSALLSRLRGALGPGVLTGRAELRLELSEPVRVDVEEGLAATGRAVHALDEGDWAAAAEQASAALALDLASFLPDVETGWAAAERRELEAVRVRALEALAEAKLRQGGPELAVAEHAARAAIAAAPFRESAHRLLMEVHEAAGNAAEGLRAFDVLRRLLREELGATPGAGVLRVHERLLRAAPLSSGGAPAGAEVPASPRGRWPEPLAAAEATELVGRHAELAALEAAWRETARGARPLVLLAGDAGMGKTRMAAALAARARDEGAVVLYGRFDEHTHAPYQPVVEMLRSWSGGDSLQGLGERLGSRAAELGVLLPEFGSPADPPLPDPTGLSAGDAHRLRFFDAVAALLAEVAGDAPLLLVVDDLQWADRPTLELLRHLRRAPARHRGLVVGTYRHTECAPGHPVHELSDDLRREGGLRRLQLAGLEEEQVGALVAALAGDAADGTFVRALHDATEGNPFFIGEVVGHLLAMGRPLQGGVSLAAVGAPQGVREVTGRRLNRLGEAARSALPVAAVIGREFDFDVLEAVAPVGGDALVGALEEAVAAGVIREAGRVGRYAFVHALLRATLYGGLSPLRRARLHGRVGEALVRLRVGELDRHLPLLAHHFAQAAPAGQPERALGFVLAAARRADRLLAWEEAAEHYRAALDALRLAGSDDDRVRAELLLELGTAEERAGAEQAARAAFAGAVDLARALGDPALLARAALGFAGQWSLLGRVDPERARLLDEALEALGGEDGALRARVLARLALELCYAPERERRLALSREAVTLARRLGEPRTLAACLVARHYALWRPETLDDRLEVVAELRHVAERTGDAELELEAAGWNVVDLMEVGDVRAADVQIAAASKLAQALHRPLWLWWTTLFRCMRAQLEGRFEAAERLAGEALEIGVRGQAENARHYHAQAMFTIRREQGRLAELEGPTRELADRYPAVPAWRAALALLELETGRPEAARASFEAIAADGFARLPVDANWLIAVTLLAEVCAGLGDARRARELSALLAPYADRNVVVGRATTVNGSASRPLGALAAVQRRWTTAERHFARALAMHERMGAAPWWVRTQLSWAEMLLARGRSGDLAEARERLEAALAQAQALGMTAVADRARELQGRVASGCPGCLSR